MYPYESGNSLSKARADWKVKGGHGYDHEFIELAELRRPEPGLSPVFGGAVFEQGVSHVSDPLKTVQGIHRYVVERGAVFHRGEADIVERTSRGVVVEPSERMRQTFDGLVITAGARSRELLNQIGDDVPLEPERGYHITIKRPNVDIQHCLVFADRGFVVTPPATRAAHRQLRRACRIGYPGKPYPAQRVAGSLDPE